MLTFFTHPTLTLISVLSTQGSVKLSDVFCERNVLLPSPFVPSNGKDFSCESSTASEGDDHSSSEVQSDCDDSVFDLQDPFDSSEFDPLASASREDGSGEKLFSASNVTVLQSLAVLFAWFSSYPGLSKEAFNRLLLILSTFLLPSGNKIPPSYYEAYAIISKRISPVEEYHCCVNGCMLYRDSNSAKYSKLTECPMCGEQRYQHFTKTPRKRFKYIPIEAH